MATYPVVNKNTGEQKEVVMSIHDWDQWLEDNPDWTRDWSDPSTAPMATDVGEWRDKLIAKNPGWNEVLAKASKAPGAKKPKDLIWQEEKEHLQSNLLGLDSRQSR